MKMFNENVQWKCSQNKAQNVETCKDVRTIISKEQKLKKCRNNKSVTFPIKSDWYLPCCSKIKG